MSKVIAIDGPGGAGKSSLTKDLSQAIGYTRLDSGAMYRCITYSLIKQNIDYTDETLLVSALDKMHIDVRDDRYFLNNEDLTDYLRSMDVSAHVSAVSAMKPVREKLLKVLRSPTGKNIIVDGRDIGTVVFPDAFLKIYLDADIHARAKRRFDELQSKGDTVDYDEVLENLKKRDERDSKRSIAPLAIAKDAVYVDTTNIDRDDVLDILIRIFEIRKVSISNLWKKFFYSITWIIMKLISRVYLRMSVVGKEKFEKHNGALIVAPNHQSFLDPLLVSVAGRLSPPLHFLAKRELSEIPVFGRVISWLNVIPVRRGMLDRPAMNRLTAILATGGRVLIFPEGTRSRDGVIKDGKDGFGKLVLEAGVPVIPVHIHGSFNSYPPGAAFPKPKKVTITWGDIWVPQFKPGQQDVSRKEYSEVTTGTMSRIKEISHLESVKAP